MKLVDPVSTPTISAGEKRGHLLSQEKLIRLGSINFGQSLDLGKVCSILLLGKLRVVVEERAEEEIERDDLVCFGIFVCGITE